ncbi:hypothetical protein [Nocardia alni]|uniref:hypothetical protein n=1 Tax=Nocardia alni TaxID=2815723 RepID=UPI001C23E495|nr:hypothetical protein [Nocardia alni]
MTTGQEQDSDRELLLVVRALERLTVRVEAQFSPEMLEAGDHDPAGTELLSYARSCQELLDDPALSSRLQAAAPRHW